MNTFIIIDEDGDDLFAIQADSFELGTNGDFVFYKKSEVIARIKSKFSVVHIKHLNPHDYKRNNN